MKDKWSTPQALFNKLDEEFGFELDVCALPDNTKCARFFSPEQDGLKQEWRGTVWMNPPYGRGLIAPWMKKAVESAGNGTIVVALIPNRTNAPWWHDYVMRAAEIRFIRKKVAFDGGEGVPFFGSVIAVFSDAVTESPKISSYEQRSSQKASGESK